MYKYLLNLGFIIFISFYSYSQTLDWVTQMKGTESNGGYSISVDNTGNVYSTGWFGGTVDFDPSATTLNITATGLLDIYIQKLDINGNLVWVKTIGGNGNSERGYGKTIKVDDNGNVFTVGLYKGTFDFDPNAGVSNLISTNFYGTFIQKLDANGNFQWAKSIGPNCNSRSFTIDKQGNIYIVGSFTGTMDFDPGAGVQNLTSVGNNDYFVLKLDNTGNFVWVKNIGGNKIDVGEDIETDDNGNIYITGCFEETVDFDPNAGVQNLTSNGAYDIFIQKLDPQGNLVWAKGIGGNGRDVGNSLKVDALGNVYSTGGFSGTVDFDPNNGIFNLTTSLQQGYMLKLANDGSFVWAKSIKWNGYESAHIDLDHNGNVYTCGYFSKTVDFDPNAGTHNISAIGMWDIYINKLDKDGNFVWAKSMKGSPDQGLISYGSRANAINIDDCSNIYITGLFQGPVDFNPDTNATKILTAVDYASDIFVQKINQNSDTIFTTDSITSCVPITWIDGNTYTTNNTTAQHISKSALGCISVTKLKLTIISNAFSITPKLIENTSCVDICDGKAEVVINGGTAPYKYNWVQSGDTSNTALNLCKGSNSIIVTDSNGCEASSDIVIKLSNNAEKDIIVPNVFTPNSDGFNDAFEIENIESAKNFNIQIFNRWGSVVYESTSVLELWNGKYKGNELTDGVYFYRIKYFDKCSNKPKSKDGSITILR